MPDFNWNQGVAIAIVAAFGIWFFKSWGPVLVDEYRKSKEEERSRNKRDEERSEKQRELTNQMATQMVEALAQIAGQHEQAAQRDARAAEVLRSIHELQIRHSQMLDVHAQEIDRVQTGVAAGFEAISKKIDGLTAPGEEDKPPRRKRGAD